MITKKPLNVNDEEVFNGMSRVERSISQPTVMSYTFQRIRLAELSRNIIDRRPLAMAQLDGLSLGDTMDIDTQLQTHLNDLPPFFSMPRAEIEETYGLTPTRAEDIVHQGHIIRFLTYAQRCKLHLPYFTRGFADPDCSSSKEICVKCARLVTQIQPQLESSGQGAGTRFKFSGLIVGIFTASIVLLMDMCMNKSSPHHETRRAEVGKAFRILEQARSESETTAKFLDSLMEMVWKYHIQPPNPDLPQHVETESNNGQQQTVNTTSGHGGVAGFPFPSGFPGRSVLDCRGRSDLNSSHSVFGVNNSDVIMATDGETNGEDFSSYFNDLAQSFEQGIDSGDFDWDNIFSGLNSSFM